MKYFAKYLPVDEKIREHDIVFAEGIRGTVVHLYKDEAFEVESGDFTDDDMRVKSFEASKVKKAKLFLCSRDIDVKSLEPLKDIFHDEKGMTHRVTQDWINGRDTFPHTWVKVIGQISPEAIWVNDGDKFDEALMLKWNTDPMNRVFGIRCPCCKTFK